MSDGLKILGKTIFPGEKLQIDVSIAKLHTHTPIHMPVFIDRSKIKGPAVMLIAGIHGDEFNGVEILRRMIRGKMLTPDRGTVICIPVVNVFGFLDKTRQFPGAKDLNRSFPGSKNGSLASRTAHLITEEILPIVDLGIDFHTGGANLQNYPHVRCHFSEDDDLDMVRAFNSRYIVRSGMLDKSLRKTAWGMGKTILVFEGGKTVEFNENVIEEGIMGTLNVMHHLGMKKKKPVQKRRNSIFLDQSKWVRAPISGMMRVTAVNGSKIKKGQVIAIISDPFGEVERKVLSPVNGFIYCINESPIVNQGDPMVHIGY